MHYAYHTVVERGSQEISRLLRKKEVDEKAIKAKLVFMSLVCEVDATLVSRLDNDGINMDRLTEDHKKLVSEGLRKREKLNEKVFNRACKKIKRRLPDFEVPSSWRELRPKK